MKKIDHEQYEKLSRYFRKLRERASSQFFDDWKEPIESWCYITELPYMKESVKYMTNCELFAHSYSEKRGIVYVQSIGYNEYRKGVKL
jgi:hypothetical protein